MRTQDGEILYVPGPTPAMMAQALAEDIGLTRVIICASLFSLWVMELVMCCSHACCGGGLDSMEQDCSRTLQMKWVGEKMHGIWGDA
jgi:hypothetical protein